MDGRRASERADQQTAGCGETEKSGNLDPRPSLAIHLMYSLQIHDFPPSPTSSISYEFCNR
jgi:hypothetical protein